VCRLWTDRARAAWCGRTSPCAPNPLLAYGFLPHHRDDAGEGIAEHAPEAASMAKNRQIGMCPEDA
jgi:hypothetical protein